MGGAPEEEGRGNGTFEVADVVHGWLWVVEEEASAWMGVRRGGVGGRGGARGCRRAGAESSSCCGRIDGACCR